MSRRVFQGWESYHEKQKDNRYFISKKREERVIEVKKQLKQRYQKEILKGSEIIFKLGISGRDFSRILLSNKLPDTTIASVAMTYVDYTERGRKL